MRRRPLCVVLVCMILGILCNAWINTKEPVSYERESIHFLCELEEFVKKDNGYTLVVRDVKGENSFSCKKIKLYASEISYKISIASLIYYPSKIAYIMKQSRYIS